MKKCPFCAEEIQDEAIGCQYCGRDIPFLNSNGQPIQANNKIYTASDISEAFAKLKHEQIEKEAMKVNKLEVESKRLNNPLGRESMSSSNNKPNALHKLVGIVTILTAIAIGLLGLRSLFSLAIGYAILFIFIGIFGFFSGTRLLKRGETDVLVLCLIFSITPWCSGIFMIIASYIGKLLMP
jgi:hypothetical protein